MSEKKKRFNLGWIGLVVSLLYLLLVCIYLFLQWDEYFAAMTPNEWGDFLSGVFGPLALAWVVLGFFLQGQELQNSVNALMLQSEELRRSVEQQRELVGVSKEQVDYERKRQEREESRRIDSIQPVLQVNLRNRSRNADGKASYILSIKNSGPAALQCDILFSVDGRLSLETHEPSIMTGDELSIKLFNNESVDPIFEETALTITYSDTDYKRWIQSFDFEIDEKDPGYLFKTKRTPRCSDLSN